MSEGIWIALISGMFGAVIGSFVTASLNHRNERKRIIYEKKFIIYAGLIELYLSKEATEGRITEMRKIISQAQIFMSHDEKLRQQMDEFIKLIANKDKNNSTIREIIKFLSDDLNKTF